MRNTKCGHNYPMTSGIYVSEMIIIICHSSYQFHTVSPRSSYRLSIAQNRNSIKNMDFSVLYSNVNYLCVDVWYMCHRTQPNMQFIATSILLPLLVFDPACSCWKIKIASMNDVFLNGVITLIHNFALNHAWLHIHKYKNG